MGALNNALPIWWPKSSHFLRSTSQEFIDTYENIFITQPGLSFQPKANMAVTTFVRGSLRRAVTGVPPKKRLIRFSLPLAAGIRATSIESLFSRDVCLGT